MEWIGPDVDVIVDNVWGRITTRLQPEILLYIDTKTKYHPPGYDKTWNFKKKRWDGFDHCFDMQNQVFRAGLLDRVVNGLKHFKIPHRVVRDTSKNFSLSAALPLAQGHIRSFDFQTGVRGVVHEYERGIIASPTGTGKTIMAALIIDELQRRTLVVLNDLVLLDQMQRSLKRSFPGITIGYIGDSEFQLGDITVATIQSLRSILGIIESKKKVESPNKQRLLDWLRGVGVVIHDEAHLADADSCLMFYGLLDSVERVYGFSATPYKWAEKQQSVANVELEQVFGHVIYNTFDNDFIALGLKVPLIVKQIELTPRVKVYGTFRDNQGELYKKALQFEIIQNDDWHQAVKESVREFTQDNMTTFVYAAHSLEYGNKLATLLGAPFVQGKTKRAERLRIFDAIARKEIPVVVSDIGGVGLDIPSLDAFVLASDAKDVRQFKGRVERASAATGKEFGHFVDIWKDCSFLNKHHDLRENQYREGQNIIL